MMGLRTISRSKMLSEINSRIKQACKEQARNSSDIKLLAVSKNFGTDKIEPLLQQGHLRFAENRVQEAESKWVDLRTKYPNIELHLIGALQSNKASSAVALFDVIHSLDRQKLAKKLASEMQEQNKSLPCFIQVNIGEEDQKAGIALAELSDFYAYATRDLSLDIIGLMAIPPVDVEPSPYFALLQKKGRELGLPHLSMGMSADFEIAIGFGADYIRIGTALFGKRD